jgi:hypothetical protein
VVVEVILAEVREYPVVEADAGETVLMEGVGTHFHDAGIDTGTAHGLESLEQFNGTGGGNG